MPFRIREDARKWFKDLREDGFSTDFDSFYFCFIAGISKSQKRDVPISETGELVDYYPDRYRDRGRLLVSLFLASELRALGVGMTEKKIVHSEISRLVKPDSPSYLSDDGMKEFNKYAFGGFDILIEWFDDRPRNLETFLSGFKSRLDEVA
ncbi:MAG: hypothetical protein Q8M53_08405 [Burkholderiales bacterium]|nr:hypothetical protein [Burkholderiales bacterium]